MIGPFLRTHYFIILLLQMAEAPKYQFKRVKLLKDQSLGIGSYGAVCKAKCDDLLCAAKIIHPTLFDPTALQQVAPQREHRLPIRRFEQECEFMSAIRYPVPGHVQRHRHTLARAPNGADGRQLDPLPGKLHTANSLPYPSQYLSRCQSSAIISPLQQNRPQRSLQQQRSLAWKYPSQSDRLWNGKAG